ncbi:hypothetical protein, partial [uncultured Ruminococcus sp.]|uniref:hypothetical protein n=1 Tax=uncultured Ruminococcus sp. TaxID=165186 RepID=UPI0025E556E7
QHSHQENVEKQAMRGSFGQSAGSPMICGRRTSPNSPYLSTFAAEKCLKIGAFGYLQQRAHDSPTKRKEVTA